MARISYEEGQKIAERAAWAEKGSKAVFWHTYGKRLIGPGLAAGAIGGVAYAIYRVAEAIGGAVSGPNTLPGSVAHAGIPMTAVVLAVLLVGATFLGVKAIGAATTFGRVMLIGFVLVVAWVGLIAWTAGTLL